MDYLVRFCGHILEEKRPPGFPAKIYQDLLVSVNNWAQLREATNEAAANFIRYQGMIVLLDPDKVITEKEAFDTRIFVPLHMVSHISTKTTKLTSDIPDIDDEVQFLQ